MSRAGTALLSVVALTAMAGCGAIKRLAIGQVGDALAAGGSVYESDDDLTLVGDALPFGLKLIESLLAEVPENLGLLTSACQGFTSYAYVYIHQEADVMALEDLDRARQMRARARRLYLRARRYGLRGLEVSHPGLSQSLASDPATALRRVEAQDLPLLYWNAAALGLAISVSLDDAEMLALLPEAIALLERALALDETWQEGSLHDLAISFASARPGSPPAPDELRAHFDRALELSGGKRASLFVGYAESASIRSQDAAQFRSLLERALAIDPDLHEEIRLANLAAQRRARWLLGRVDELFLEPSGVAADPGGSP